MPISSLWHRYAVNSSPTSPLEFSGSPVLYTSSRHALITWFHYDGNRMNRSPGFLGAFSGSAGGKEPCWEQSTEIYGTDMPSLSWVNHIKSKYVSCLWICKAIMSHCSKQKKAVIIRLIYDLPLLGLFMFFINNYIKLIWLFSKSNFISITGLEI